MKRREFLRQMVVSASGLLVYQGFSSSADEGPILSGGGTHVFELVEGWGALPEGIGYGYTHGIVTDSQDRVYVHNMSKHSVVVFDREGNFLTSWGEDFEKGAHGIYVSREGDTEYLYLSDFVRHLVIKTTLDGEEVWRLGVPPNLTEVYPTEESYRPTDVAIAPNGHFYVCDGYGKHWIHEYSPDAEYIKSWGGTGTEPGKMNCPHGIWVDTRGETPFLSIADRENHRLQNFTLDGEHIAFVTDDLRRPACYYQFGDDMYVPDLHGRVTILDKNYRLITHVGDNPGVWEQKGWPNFPHEARILGKFISPHAACVDSHGDLYVAEWVGDGRITKWRRRAA